MKEKIQKLAASLASAATLLKEEKTDEAAEALGQIAEETASLVEEAEAVEAASAEKDATIEKNAQEIKKYADLYVSAPDLSKLIEDLASVKALVTEAVGITKAASTKEDVASVSERLSAIEKAAESKQIQDEKRESMAKSAGISGLSLIPRA